MGMPRMETLKRFGPTIGLVLLNAWIGFHAMEADNGPAALVIANQQITTSQAELESLRLRRLDLEDQAARLSPDRGTLDLDYVAELAREKLQYAHPDEVILRLDLPS